MRARWAGPSERIGTSTGTAMESWSVPMSRLYGFSPSQCGSAAHGTKSACRTTSSYGHGRGGFDTVEHEARLAVLHAGVLEQRLHDEAAVVRHVLDHHAQQEIHLAREGDAFDHLGPALHAGTEQVHRVALVVLGVLFEPHVDVGGEPQTHGLGTHQRHVAIDDAALLHALDAPQHGTGRQADLPAGYVVGRAAVVLQRTQDDMVELVQCSGVGHRAILLSRMEI